MSAASFCLDEPWDNPRPTIRLSTKVALFCRFHGSSYADERARALPPDRCSMLYADRGESLVAVIPQQPVTAGRHSAWATLVTSAKRLEKEQLQSVSRCIEAVIL